jgi:hypothetical protein
MGDPITARAIHQFTVAVPSSGQLDIACDPIDLNLAVAGHEVSGLDPPEGVTAERAGEIEACLDDHLHCKMATRL